MNSGAQYPPFDLAVKLENAGFNEPCVKMISLITKQAINCNYFDIANNIEYDNQTLKRIHPDYISYPSIYEIANWLRNKYSIHIDVDYDASQLWGFSLRHCNDRDDYIDGDSMFINYESALVMGEFDALRYIETDSL